MRQPFLAGLAGLLFAGPAQAATLCNTIDDALVFEREQVCVSSALPSQSGNSYGADNLQDGDPRTAWCEASSGHGEGTEITWEWQGAAPLRGIWMTNGYTKSDSIWAKNSRIRDIVIEVWIEGSRPDDFIRYYQTLEDRQGEQLIAMRDPLVPLRKLVIRIDSVYPGSKWSDTCITEVWSEFGL